MKWFPLLLIFFISACKSKGPVCLIDVTDIIKSGKVHLIALKDSGNKITALYDDGLGQFKRRRLFVLSKSTIEILYILSEQGAVYMESYDEHGYLIGTKGSPMVDRIINELGDDSAYVQVYFFRTMKSYQQLNIKINNNAAVNYTLQKDTYLFKYPVYHIRYQYR